MSADFMMKTMRIWLLALLGMVLFVSGALGGEPIKIAAIYAITGAAGSDNQGSIDGVRYAVDEINRQGGVLDSPLELAIIDNKSTPIGSHVAALEAVENNVAAIIGPAWSSHSLAVGKVAQVHGIPMITNVSTHPGVTRIGDYIFRVCFTDSFQGKALAWLARHELQAENVVLFTNLNSDFSMELARTFREAFLKQGGRISKDLNYKQKQGDFRSLLEQVKNADPDLLVFTGHHESGAIIRQAIEVGIKAIPIGGDGWESEVFNKKGGNELEKGYFITHWAKEMDNPASRDFVEKYGKTVEPVPSTALAYDAVFVLADAIRRARSTDHKNIRDALALTRSFQGVTGTITFDQNGDPIDKNAVIITINHGKKIYYHTVRAK